MDTEPRPGASEVDQARARLGQLAELQAAGRYAEAVRESQAAVAQALQGLLRRLGVDVADDQDAARLLSSRRDELPPTVARHLKEIRRIGKQLRGEQDTPAELAHEDADMDTATESIELAGLVVGWVEAGVRELDGG